MNTTQILAFLIVAAAIVFAAIFFAGNSARGHRNGGPHGGANYPAPDPQSQGGKKKRPLSDLEITATGLAALNKANNTAPEVPKGAWEEGSSRTQLIGDRLFTDTQHRWKGNNGGGTVIQQDPIVVAPRRVILAQEQVLPAPSAHAPAAGLGVSDVVALLEAMRPQPTPTPRQQLTDQGGGNRQGQGGNNQGGGNNPNPNAQGNQGGGNANNQGGQQGGSQTPPTGLGATTAGATPGITVSQAHP